MKFNEEETKADWIKSSELKKDKVVNFYRGTDTYELKVFKLINKIKVLSRIHGGYYKKATIGLLRYVFENYQYRRKINILFNKVNSIIDQYCIVAGIEPQCMVDQSEILIGNRAKNVLEEMLQGYASCAKKVEQKK